MSNLAHLPPPPEPIRRRRPDATYELVYVSPELAQHWLDTCNTHNRPISKGRVAQYADDMATNRWEYNGEAIQFAIDGTLLNGQHRLLAICASGVGQYFLIVHGLKPSTQSVMDQGTRRAPHEQLTLAGIPVNNSVAAAARIRLRWERGALFGNYERNKITAADLLEWAQYNGETLTLMSDLYRTPLRRNFPRPSYNLAIGSRLQEVARDDADDFLDSFTNGANLPPNSPILALRTRIVMRPGREGIRFNEKDYIAYFVMAWNAFRQGRSLSKLVRHVWTPENFPEPQ